MKRRLRSPQLKAMKYVDRTDHPALFMEMRLGKTLVVIRKCNRYIPRNRKDGLRILIVATNSALGSWEEELIEEKEFDFQFLQGTKKQRLKMLKKKNLKKWNLINKEGWIAIPELALVKWDAVILDESHFIKNPRAKITKFFLKNFRRIPHRWILTGTPAPQGVEEFWTQLCFLNGAFMGTSNFWNFRSKYFSPHPFGYGFEPNIGVETKIKEEVAKVAFVLRREDVKLDVPKVYERRFFTMPPAIEKTYNTLLDEMILEFKNKEIKRTKFAPVKLQYLRQLCSGFIEKELVWNAKINELIDLLSGELKNDQVVLWVNFNHELHEISRQLKSSGISCRKMYGATSPVTRRRFVREFKKGKFQVFIIQSAVGETGMNLSAADTAIYFSPPLGVKTRSQTEDRILDVYKKGPLLILDFIVKNSAEQVLLDNLLADQMKSKWNLKRIFKMIERQRNG